MPGYFYVSASRNSVLDNRKRTRCKTREKRQAVTLKGLHCLPFCFNLSLCKKI